MWHSTSLITWIPYRPLHPFLMGAGIVGIILAVLIWLLPIILIIGIIDWLFSSDHDKEINDSSLEILRERYAKGEISKEEFEEKKRGLA